LDQFFLRLGHSPCVEGTSLECLERLFPGFTGVTHHPTVARVVEVDLFSNTKAIIL
jgi:hypothetical protein